MQAPLGIFLKKIFTIVSHNFDYVFARLFGMVAGTELTRARMYSDAFTFLRETCHDSLTRVQESRSEARGVLSCTLSHSQFAGLNGILMR